MHLREHVHWEGEIQAPDYKLAGYFGCSVQRKLNQGTKAGQTITQKPLKSLTFAALENEVLST